MRAAILAFLLGVCLLQTQAQLPTYSASLGLLLLASASLLLRRLAHQRFLRVVGLLVCAASSGFLWAALLAQQSLSRALPAAMEGQDITVVGSISKLPQFFERGVRFEFTIEQIIASAEQANANVWTKAKGTQLALSWYADEGSNPPMLKAGERWQLRLRLQKPHGNANPYGFDYEVWLLEQGVRATGYVRPDADLPANLVNRRLAQFVPSFNNLVEASRESLRNRLLAALPDKPYAGVLVALVIGDQRAVAQSDWQLFNNTGIGHLMSISGLHITMVAGMFAWVAGFLWRHSFFTQWQLPLILPAQKVAALAAVFAACTYVLLAGFGVPAQRTLYMLGVVALATWLGRISQISHVLCLALMLVLLLDPWAVLWPGFWLSFAAVGLILYSSVGRNRGVAAALQQPSLLEDLQPVAVSAWQMRWKRLRQRLWRELRLAAHLQWVITIGLVPLSLLLFAQISLISPLANAIAIPLVGLVITPLALIAAVLPSPIMQWLLLAAHFLLECLVALLNLLCLPGFVTWSTPQANWWQFAFAMAGILLMFAPRGWPGRVWGIVLCLPLLLNRASAPTEGQMWVTAFDVGQGTALLIETAQHRLLYDTGPAYSRQNGAAQRVILPYLKARGINQLDGLIISHADNDHSGGALSILRQLPMQWLATSITPQHPIMQEVAKMQQAGKIRAMPCLAGQQWQWNGVQMAMLHPSPENYAAQAKTNALSCTLKISLGKQAILLTGDIEAAQEAQLLESMPQALQANVLLVPHHGSGTSSSEAFLKAVQPRLAIFQLGYRNRYRHPKAEVWQRYQELGITRLRSDQAGAVSLRFSEQGVEVQQYRLEHARYWYGR